MDESITGSSAAFLVQVCYVRPDLQILLDFSVEAGTSIEQAIRLSGILEQAPEVDLSNNRVGIYGQIKTLDTLLRAQDRIEIYRPLLSNPQEARRRRAQKIG